MSAYVGNEEKDRILCIDEKEAKLRKEKLKKMIDKIFEDRKEVSIALS